MWFLHRSPVSRSLCGRYESMLKTLRSNLPLRIDWSGQRWNEGRLMSETIYNHSTTASQCFFHHHGDVMSSCYFFPLWYLQTGSRAVTFLCAKVHFHSGVSPGVQDLPGNDADDRHPERHREETRLWLLHLITSIVNAAGIAVRF